MSINDLMLNLNVRDFGLLFDPKEIHGELADLRFLDVPYPKIREKLADLRDYVKSVALSQILDSNGKVEAADATFRHNSEVYVQNALRYHDLLAEYSFDPSDSHSVRALMDLTLRLELTALEPEARQAEYQKVRLR